MEKGNADTQSMYLSTIPNSGKKFGFIRSTLDISDIQGSKSRFLEHSKLDRYSSLKSNDIEKSCPRQLIPTTVNKPSFVLQIDDIEGTRSKVTKFTTTRQTNPLQPHYQEPYVEYMPAPQPKFLRDNMTIDDIEGVRSKVTFAQKIERAGKVIDNKGELVAGIKPTPKGFVRNRTCNDFWNVKDINNSISQRQNRRTNPLEPRYDLPSQKNYGEIDGSKQVVKNNGLPLRQNNSLITDDIDGAKPKVNNFVNETKEDIPGAKPSTLKRGISSNRKTNPLQPNYNYPGCTESSQTFHLVRPRTAVQRFDAFIK